MTKDNLQVIENTLDVRLPRSYATLMGSATDLDRRDFWFRSLFADPDVVVEHTLRLRELMESYGLAFHASFVVVSTINGGDDVILDTAATGDDLLVCDHETNRVEPLGITLGQFGSKV